MGVWSAKNFKTTMLLLVGVIAYGMADSNGQGLASAGYEESVLKPVNEIKITGLVAKSTGETGSEIFMDWFREFTSQYGSDAEFYDIEVEELGTVTVSKEIMLGGKEDFTTEGDLFHHESDIINVESIDLQFKVVVDEEHKEYIEGYNCVQQTGDTNEYSVHVTAYYESVYNGDSNDVMLWSYENAQ